MDWPSLFDFSHLPHFLAQAATPSAAKSPDQLDLLRQQLEFLKAENARLNADFIEKLKLVTEENKALSESFKNFVGTMQFVLVVFGFLGGILAYIFGNNLNDAKKVAREAMTQQVETKISHLVQEQVDIVTRTLRRERVLSTILVDYYLPEATTAPTEFDLLQARGFQSVRFRTSEAELRQSFGDVVVLDLLNYQSANQIAFPALPEADREAITKHQVELLQSLFPRSAAIVVYVRPPVKYLNTIPAQVYLSPANNPITLVGMVADAAYVAVGDRQR